MKKQFFSILICMFLLFAGTSCSEEQQKSLLNGNSLADTLTLTLSDTIRCQSSCIKLATNHSPAVSYSITPNGFDMETLQKKGYYMNINVSYSVYYRKDWSLGIGYFGSPKYEISILNSNMQGNAASNLTTSTKPKNRSFSFRASIADLRNTTLTLTFSTDNIQNIMYFSNIVVQYDCFK